MTRGWSLRRLWRYHPFVVVVSAVLLLASGVAVVGGTFASFVAETQNTTSTFPAGWIGLASNLTVTPSGYDGQLAWTPGTHGPVTGQQVWGHDNGSSSTCPGSGYSQIGSNQSATTSTFTDSHATNALNGHYECYEMISTSASSWTGTASFSATQLGLVATSVVITNGPSGQLNTGDTIVVTYNQQPTLSAAGLTNGVCASWDASANVTLFLDYSTCANPPTSPNYQLKITGLTKAAGVAGHGNANFSAVTTSSSAPWTVTYTLSANLAQAMNPGTGTAVPDGSGTYVKSAAVTDQASACTSPTYNCTPSATLH